MKKYTIGYQPFINRGYLTDQIRILRPNNVKPQAERKNMVGYDVIKKYVNKSNNIMKPQVEKNIIVEEEKKEEDKPQIVINGKGFKPKKKHKDPAHRLKMKIKTNQNKKKYNNILGMAINSIQNRL